MSKQAIVWNPVTGDQLRVPLPRAVLTSSIEIHATVIGNDDYQLSPFKLVMVWNHFQHGNLLAYLFRSEAGVWENVIIPTSLMAWNHICGHSVLFGNTLCWLIDKGRILQIDLDKKSLVVMSEPVCNWYAAADSAHIVRTCDNGLGIAILSGMSVQVWDFNPNSDAVEGWVLKQTIELDKLLPRELSLKTFGTTLLGFVEDVNAIFLRWGASFYVIQLDSLQFTEFSKNALGLAFHPYASFFTAEKRSS